MATTCTHLGEARILNTDKDYCEECLKSGSRWVHLRLCLSCGHVGCCDSSPNRHASRHFHETTHPLARSIEPGERWVWCYADDVMAGEIAS
ncbi:UBP-type zinc finger domain-containing protein [Burkholderia cepacia]|nr:UBP-type zinc finger domain-containing protein [Burkholderia cepacia]